MNSTNTKDLLFTLVFVFIVLFSLSFMLINEPTEDENGDIDSQNQLIVTLRWEQNCDVDLWMMLPDGRKVFYNERNQPPAFLDIDVVCWNSYADEDSVHVIKNNQEVITIRDALFGEYYINTHLFNPQHEVSVEIEVIVYDIKNKRIMYADSRVLTEENRQEHIVTFSLVESRLSDFSVEKVDDSNPVYFIGGE